MELERMLRSENQSTTFDKSSREFKEILLELDTIVFSLLQTKMEKIGRAALKSGNPNDIIEEQRNAARDIASGV